MAIWRFVKQALAITFGILLLETFLAALSGAWDYSDFPEMLLIKALAWPTIFPIHMVSGALALLLVPAAVWVGGSPAHRIVAPLAAVDVVVAGLTAVPVALESPITTLAAAGFVTQATLWLALLTLGFVSIRRGDAARHRRYMLQMAALTFGAMAFRVYLALWVGFAGYAHFKAFYSCDAWIAWITPWAAMRIWLSLEDRRAAALAQT